MPFDSSGTFNRLRSWVADAAANIKIRSDYHDQEDDGFAAGLSTCITKDGRTQPVANLPMNGKKLLNLGEPTEPSDAATKNYVDNFKTFTTGASIIGAGFPNGFLTFSSMTGITGISWANADMSWLGKTAEAGKWRQRLTVNSNAIGSGSDIFTIDKGGFLQIAGQVSHNLSFDGTDWRTDAAGTGTLLTMQNGAFSLKSNDELTTNPNAIATLKEWFSISQTSMALTSDDSAFIKLSKKGSGKSAQIWGMNEDELRWIMTLGTTTPESGTWKGSDFALAAYDNDGANGKQLLEINRETGKMVLNGSLAVGSTISGTSAGLIVASGVGGQSIWFYPNGPANSTGQAIIGSDGIFYCSGGLQVLNSSNSGCLLGLGQGGKNGYVGGYTGYWHNWLFSSGLIYCMVNGSNYGAIQMVCDYRYKKDVADLPPTWDAVKKLRPISFHYKANPDIPGDKDAPELRWGFIAHELQKTLTKSAANGEKDEPNVVQSPNMMVIVAALTKALQEAQLRIEALEAKLA